MDRDRDRVLREQQRWRVEREYLSARRRELTAYASGLYPGATRLGDSGLLTRAEWVPGRPIPLDALTLLWADPPVPAAVRGEEPETAGVRPCRLVGGRFDRYSAAIAELDPPRVFENRPAYRLTGATLATEPAGGGAVGVSGAGCAGVAGCAGCAGVAGDLPPAGQMAFTMGRYFDNADVGEAVAHELAAQMMGGRQPALADLPIRCMVGDPTDPGRRSMPVAITTLTIRYDSRRHEARFLTHWRDPALVATNGDMYTVVPVGMFQPAGTTRGDGTGDFDLWRGMAREYSEELLGNAEHRDVNYQAWAFFTTLERLRAEGSCRPYCCGIGVDPLTLATDLLAVTVFEAAAFDELFADLVEDNDEGHTVVRGSDGTFGTLFCAEEIHRLVAVEHVQSAGAAVLEAAWRMRSALVGV